MKRNTTIPRNNWQQAVEKIGFGFHTTNVPYWDESVYYTFEMAEILQIESATATLWQICLDAVQYVIDKKLYSRFQMETRGEYGTNKTIFQSMFSLPAYDGRYPVIGSWVIGQQPAGIGVRESDSLITSNTSRFVPHLIIG